MFVLIFLMLVMTIHAHAMELRASSGSSSSIHTIPYNDSTKPLASTETSDSEVSSKKVHFDSSASSSYDSFSHSKSPRDSLSTRKNSKSKKETYKEQKKKELLALMKGNNTEDILDFLIPNVNVADKEGKTPLIIAIQKNNDTLIDMLLLSSFKTDVSQADNDGNTPLHHAFCQQKDTLIERLIHDYRVNSLLRNKKGWLAHQCCTGDQFSQQKLLHLRALFFIRSRLDSVIDKAIPNVRGHLKTMQNLQETIDAIKKEIAEDAIKQGDNALPENIQLPTDDDFIKKVIIYRFAKQGIATSQPIEIRNNISLRDVEDISSVRK